MEEPQRLKPGPPPLAAMRPNATRLSQRTRGADAPRRTENRACRREAPNLPRPRRTERAASARWARRCAKRHQPPSYMSYTSYVSYRVTFQSVNQLISGAALLPPLVLIADWLEGAGVHRNPIGSAMRPYRSVIKKRGLNTKWGEGVCGERG